MWNLDGWQEVSCKERDDLWKSRPEGTTPLSSLTDPDGNYGPKVVFTEWGTDAGPILRDYRHGDRSCEHFVPVGTDGGAA